MKQTIAVSDLNCALGALNEINSKLRVSDELNARAPVHVVYGGAHIYKADTPRKLGQLAFKSLQEYASNSSEFAEVFELDSKIAQTVFERVVRKLENQAVEDFRIDFEDGYGFRSNDEEDQHAIAASSELAKAFHENTISPFCGFRIKSFQTETAARAIRTLDLFLTNLLEKTGGKLPENFVVTLPKVQAAGQIAVLAGLLEDFERKTGLAENLLKIEFLIETPEAIIDSKGENPLFKFAAAARGRCIAVHFGAYDFTSAFGITAEHQDLKHPLCDFARNFMQVALAPLKVRLSDSVTTLLPVPIYKNENLSAAQLKENREAIHAAWREHFQNVTRSLSNGFYQSWDLHPSQLVARYAAVYSFFLNSLDSSASRLRGFLDKATKANLTGNQFDDAASANGLLNFFNRGLSCGALEESEVLEATNLSLEELRGGSFAKIAEERPHSN